MADEALLFQIAEKIGPVPDEELCPVERTFKLIWELEAEVNNGGFQQYFLNSSGRDASRAVEALTLVGAKKCAKLLDQAMHCVDFGAIDWPNDSSRQTAISDLSESVEDQLSKIDDEFFQYPDNLSEQLTAFATSHRTDFGI